MFTITKEFTFSASHQLAGLPQDHQCSRLHGHNYRVEIMIQSEKLLPVGFIVDYGDLKAFKDYIDFNLDHRHLNEVVSFNPTAELLAKHLNESR
jgi:6-pyruvoyltetrahydropterin/6-carboxytetrahydropterin synthase